MRGLSLGDWILTILGNIFGKIWPGIRSKYTNIIILVGLTFIFFLMISGSLDIAIQWAKIMWNITGIATITTGKLIFNRILQAIM